MIFFFPEILKHVKEKLELHWADSVKNILKAFSLKEVRYQEYETLKITIFGVSFAILMYLFPNAGWQLLLIAPLMAIFNGLSNINLTGLISRSVGPAVFARRRQLKFTRLDN